MSRDYSNKEIIVLTILWTDLFEVFCSHVQDIVDGHAVEGRIAEELVSALLSAMCILVGIYSVYRQKIGLLTFFIVLVILGITLELIVIVHQLAVEEPLIFSHGMMFRLLCSSVVGMVVAMLSITLRQEYRERRFQEPDLEMFI